MSCFPCFGSHRTKRSNSRRVDHAHASPVENEMKKQKPDALVEVDVSQINAKTYTFRELATATKNFRQECLLGEGGFGRVYKGTLQSSGQVVAVKQLDRNGMQGNKEFLGEVLSLSLLHHPNLVNLIGYCADGDQRLLVHEFIPGGTLEDRVLGNESGHETLNWYTRIKIAYGTALGLEYLHEKANPPIIYRDLKSSNILIDEEFNPKLSDIGLAKLGHNGDKMHGPSRLMGAYGFCAPEYSRTGEVTMKSDVYSYGVILLELITGRRAIDTTRANNEQNLVAWAQPLFRDPKNFPDMADPLLKKQFPEKDLNQAIAIAAMCLQEEATVRPFMSDVVTTLSFLSTTPPPDEAVPSPVPDSSDGSECISDDDGESIRSSDNNRHDGIAGNEAVTGSSHQYLSFERDESVSSSNHTVSKSNKGDHHHMVSNSSQDKYENVNSRSNSGESAEEDQGVSDNNSAVTQKEESKTVGDRYGGISLIGVMSTSRSPENRIQKGDSKSLNYLDRTRSRREPVLPVNIPPIKTAR